MAKATESTKRKGEWGEKRKGKRGATKRRRGSYTPDYPSRAAKSWSRGVNRKSSAKKVRLPGKMDGDIQDSY